MKKPDALAKWSDACSVSVAGGIIVRDGNWTTLARAMRHCTDDTELSEKGSLNGDAVVEVKPARKDTALGKLPMPTDSFLLVVR